MAALACGARRPRAACALPHSCPTPCHPPPRPPPRQVFYNNLLSLPFIASMMLVTGEARSVWQEPDLANPTFLLVAGLSGAIGFGIRWVLGCMLGAGCWAGCWVLGAGRGSAGMLVGPAPGPGAAEQQAGGSSHPPCVPSRPRPLAFPPAPPSTPLLLLRLLPSYEHPSFTSLWFLSTTTPSIYSLVRACVGLPVLGVRAVRACSKEPIRCLLTTARVGVCALKQSMPPLALAARRWAA